ncbi:Gfo/Idh/MocA family oxidoreductase [Gammaproteobacteria bacterium]|nr:Gfo/Idh/MocA family oxidoreductase [Gammaproteobacteria bacterium]
MIRTLIVGLGWWGKTLVDSVFDKSDKIKICYGLTRTASEEAKIYGKSKGMELLNGNFADVIQDIDIDAVILATPHSQHPEQVKISSKYGKHIACEKPFTLNRRDAISTIAEVEKNGVTLSVLYNRRFNPIVIEIQKLIEMGKLGTIVHLESNFSGDTALRWMKDKTSWRFNPDESPLGSMTSRGLHVVDTLVSFCGEISKVFATSGSRVLDNLDDMTSCLLWFKEGMTGYIATSNVTTPFWWLKVYGSQATAEMRNYNTLVFHERGKEAVIRSFDDIDIERAELEAFCDDITKGKRFSIPKNEMINVCSFLEASALSSNTNTQIDLFEDLRGDYRHKVIGNANKA